MAFVFDIFDYHNKAIFNAEFYVEHNNKKIKKLIKTKQQYKKEKEFQKIKLNRIQSKQMMQTLDEVKH